MMPSMISCGTLAMGDVHAPPDTFACCGDAESTERMGQDKNQHVTENPVTMRPERVINVIGSLTCRGRRKKMSLKLINT
jgi:hypothetical protein